MIEAKEHFHGSDLEKIEALYHISKDSITSFSANVNPLGISPLLRKKLAENLDVITSYPDREYTQLRISIGKYTGCNPDYIMVGGGSTELISLMMKLTHPKKAMLVGPTYSEYEHEITLAGGSYYYYYLSKNQNFSLDLEDLRDSLATDTDLLVLCNPNNPTSTALCQDELQALLELCRSRNILVMIDETYVEFASAYEKINAIPFLETYENLIILRGVSKFFAAPGLRLGYGMTSQSTLKEALIAIQNPWSVSSLAALAGEIMYSDHDYIQATKEHIRKERQRIYEALGIVPGLKVYEPVANFILVEILRSDLTGFDLFEKAIQKGLMIRDCSNFPSLSPQFFRFCFMSEEKNTELLSCIKEFMETGISE